MTNPISAVDVALLVPADEFPTRRFQVKHGLTAFDPKENEEQVEGFGIGRSSRRTKNPFYTASSENAWFNSPVVSRRHAVFSIDDSNPPQLTIMDVKATHGVSVNGVPLKPRQAKVVRSGDRILLGDYVQQVAHGRRETWEPREIEVQYSVARTTSHEESYQSSTARSYIAPYFELESDIGHSEANTSDESDADSTDPYGSITLDDDEDDLEEEPDDEDQDLNDDVDSIGDIRLQPAQEISSKVTAGMKSESHSSPETRFIEDSMPNDDRDEEADSDIEFYRPKRSQETGSYATAEQAANSPLSELHLAQVVIGNAVEAVKSSLGQLNAVADGNEANSALALSPVDQAIDHEIEATPHRMSLNSILVPRTQASDAADDLENQYVTACKHTFAYEAPTSTPSYQAALDFHSRYEAQPSYGFSDQLAWQTEEHTSHMYDQGPFQTPGSPSPQGALPEPPARKNGISIGDILDEQEDSIKRTNKRKSSDLETFTCAASSDSDCYVFHEQTALNSTPIGPKAGALGLTPPSSPPSEPTLLALGGEGHGEPAVTQGDSDKPTPTPKKLKVHFETTVGTAAPNTAKAAAKTIAIRKNTKKSRLQGVKSNAMTVALSMVAGGVAVFSALAFSPEEWFL